ncbi:hypothetical protein RFI_23447, partial [Reticulomyxa filosa]
TTTKTTTLDGLQSLSMSQYLHLIYNIGIHPLGIVTLLDTDNLINTQHLHDMLMRDEDGTVTADQLWRQLTQGLELSCTDDNGPEWIAQIIVDFYRMMRKDKNKQAHFQTLQLNRLDSVPYLFEMKVLVKLGKLLRYIDVMTNSLLVCNSKSLEIDKNMHGTNVPLSLHHPHHQHASYRVYSEQQITNGICQFGKYRCTPDVVLNKPIWINQRPVFWIDAKCTRGVRLLMDEKRKRQIRRFTRHYGPGAIVAFGAVDLTQTNIRDCIVLDGCGWL